MFLLNNLTSNNKSLSRSKIFPVACLISLTNSVSDLSKQSISSTTFVNKEISVGDYVLTGGELPALVLCDCIIRLLPGSMNNSTCALSDSFQDNLLAPPIYTRPANFKEHAVPDVLLSGNSQKISER